MCVSWRGGVVSYIKKRSWILGVIWRRNPNFNKDMCWKMFFGKICVIKLGMEYELTFKHIHMVCMYLSLHLETCDCIRSYAHQLSKPVFPTTRQVKVGRTVQFVFHQRVPHSCLRWSKRLCLFYHGSIVGCFV